MPVAPYKAKFIQHLLDAGALKIGGPYSLKSGRLSPWFVNTGAVSDGTGLAALSDAYAAAILDKVGEGNFDGVVGIPEKGKLFVGAVAMQLAAKGKNATYTSWRKEAKTYGEATKADASELEKRQKEVLLGAMIPTGSRPVLVDDVITDGASKVWAIETLRGLTQDVRVPGLIIAADRQEMSPMGGSAIVDFTREHRVPVYAVVDAVDVFSYLKGEEKLAPADETAFLNYFRAWGTPELRKSLGITNPNLIEGRYLIPACDTTDLEKFEEVVRATAENERVAGYKIGFMLGLTHGLSRVAEVARTHTPDKRLIYDHQKAGTDIGDVRMARNFTQTVQRAGFDTIILFPLSGPVTQTAWTGEALQTGLNVIVGGHMTHSGYVARDGGYLRDDAPEEIYRRAARHGVTNFVVPGNKLEEVLKYRRILKEEGLENPALFAPGFIAQGGDISETGRAAGENFGAIVGSALMDSTDVKTTAEELTRQLAA